MADAVDEYIRAFPKNTQEILEKIRQLLHQAVPDAAEKISYGVPTITLGGKYVVYFAGYRHHLAIYPLPRDAALHEVMAPYVAGKGTLKFPLDKPIPYDLIKRVAAALLQDYERRSA